MKEIIIKESNREQIIAALEEAQKRARERKISLDVIETCLEQVNRNLGIPKHYMEGIEVDVDVNAQDFPRAYKYTPISTKFTARFHNGIWRLTSVERAETRGDGKRILLTLTKEAEERILKRYRTM